MQDRSEKCLAMSPRALDHDVLRVHFNESSLRLFRSSTCRGAYSREIKVANCSYPLGLESIRPLKSFFILAGRGSVDPPLGSGSSLAVPLWILRMMHWSLKHFLALGLDERSQRLKLLMTLAALRCPWITSLTIQLQQIDNFVVIEYLGAEHWVGVSVAFFSPSFGCGVAQK